MQGKDDGETSSLNSSPKGKFVSSSNLNMNNFVSTKFNSKVYAQKTMKNLMDDRQTALSNMYAVNQNNIATDTLDLVEYKTSKTQYKEEHFAVKSEGHTIEQVTSVLSLKYEETGVQTDGTGGKWLDENQAAQYNSLVIAGIIPQNELMMTFNDDTGKLRENVRIPLGLNEN